jgi:hypothetical protein
MSRSLENSLWKRLWTCRKDRLRDECMCGFQSRYGQFREKKDLCSCQESKSYFPVHKLYVAQINKLLTQHRVTVVAVLQCSGCRLWLSGFGENHGWRNKTVWHDRSQKYHPLAPVFQYKMDVFKVMKAVKAVLRSVLFRLLLPFKNSLT